MLPISTPGIRRSAASPAPVQPTLRQRRTVRPQRPLAQRVATKLTGLLAILGVMGFVVSVSIPAAAFRTPENTPGSVSAKVALQSLETESTAEVTPLTRDEYTVTSRVEQLRAKYSSRSYSYSTNPGGSIQWPFPVTVPIASGFGDRLAPCASCSSFHQGVDFLPGAGTPIGAIAGGIVSLVKSDRGGLGQHVIVDHVVNGQKVQSFYAHMLVGSFAVAVGDTVQAGQILGQVGSTGASTGAHLHLEIHVNGVPVDPFVWLKANAN